MFFYAILKKRSLSELITEICSRKFSSCGDREESLSESAVSSCMPVRDVLPLRGRFPCESGTRGQGLNTMVKCKVRTINVSGHKLIEFLPDK